MTLTKTLGVAVAALVLSSGISMADTAASAANAKPAAQVAMAQSAKTSKLNKSNVQTAAQSEQSKACSAQADAKNLHGQPRREFRRSCLKSAADAKPAGAAEAVASVKTAPQAGAAAH